jgi:hypothetical protein
MWRRPSAPVQLVVGGISLPIGPMLHPGANHFEIPLPCFKGADFNSVSPLLTLRTDSNLDIDLKDARLVENKAAVACPA